MIMHDGTKIGATLKIHCALALVSTYSFVVAAPLPARLIESSLLAVILEASFHELSGRFAMRSR